MAVPREPWRDIRARLQRQRLDGAAGPIHPYERPFRLGENTARQVQQRSRFGDTELPGATVNHLGWRVPGLHDVGNQRHLAAGRLETLETEWHRHQGAAAEI